MISFRTVSGRLINLDHPRVDDIDITDIACGLSHCCRFAGQLPKFYSVCQHSLLVAALVDPPLRLAALLHDASEAYMGDLPRNLKHSGKLDGYIELERRLTEVIEKRFGFSSTESMRKHVKLADDLAACYEQIVLRDGHAFSQSEVQRLLHEHFIQWHSEKELAPFVARLPAYAAAHVTSAQARKQFLLEFSLAYRNQS